MADSPIRFRTDVLPILAENCFSCHGFDKKKRAADLRLDDRAAAVDHGAIVPGDAATSAVVERIEATDADVVMPPPHSGKSLTPAQRDLLRRWIAEGAEYEPHWAFAPPVRAAPPAVPGVGHPIDRFIRGRLATAGLEPSPPAAPATLARRVHLDLVGLPPSPAEVEAFVRDPRPDAYERLVDTLLASPHHGERWGRWWLDQARYADSHGYSLDRPRRIWKYRDWVIDAVNADMPFDRFTIEQLAGDLLPEATEAQRIATGFHRNTQINQEGGVDPEQYRIEAVFDRVATTSTVWLGLTIGCAQCHDHKFDPVEQREYYGLFALFNDQDEVDIKLVDDRVDVAALARARDAARVALEAHMQSLASAQAAWEAGLTEAARLRLAGKLQGRLAIPLEKRSFDDTRQILAATVGVAGDEFFRLDDEYNLAVDAAQGVTTMVLAERKEPRKSSVFVMGDFTRPADEAAPGTPAVLPPLAASGPRPSRLDLARWLVSPANPLTARVIVNRVWQQYFGVGLVETDNDFGLIGTPPSHPELLDWLACEFRDGGWSLKKLHRLIVTSETYRQSSARRADVADRDPLNRLLARQQRLRLDAEGVRDVALAASGLLVPAIGGPPVFPPIPPGVTDQGQVNQAWPESRGADRHRRAVYTFRFRATPVPALAVFDAPDGSLTCTRRGRSTTPLQALTLLNDKAFFEFAGGLEKVIRAEGVEAAFVRCTSRPPAAAELAALAGLDPLAQARVLLNLHETITRE
ncbi:MAG: PSD1 and planctomycete cytochrome C domain-containing protein [Planctomycetia bacterium]